MTTGVLVVEVVGEVSKSCTFTTSPLHSYAASRELTAKPVLVNRSVTLSVQVALGPPRLMYSVQPL